MIAPNPRSHEIRYCGETIVSFAQNYEDALIFRALGGKRNGRFLDVGAGHPVADNVTMWLSMMGWTGVNVEPNPIMYHELTKYRRQDVNLNVGLADKAGHLPFYRVRQNDLGHGWGMSSFDLATKGLAMDLGFVVDTMPVDVNRLMDLVGAFRADEFDLFKLDVEGSEKVILGSIDWTRFSPRLICIEAVAPGSARPTWQDWESYLTDAGYAFAHFDGCNAYYALSSERDILGQLSAGMNSNDRVRRATESDYPAL